MINKQKYYIKDGTIILKTKEYNPKFIGKSFSDKAFTDNFLTADIETLTKVDDKGKRYFEPYSVAYYDGNNSKSYYVTDFETWEAMILKMFKDLFNLKLKNVDIYFHNLSGFDVNFMLSLLVNVSEFIVQPILRDGKYIQIKISYGDYSINLKDYLLIIPGSLSNLSKSFKIDTPKEVFPRKLFEQETFSANYVSGKVPNYEKYFNQFEVSKEDYLDYVKSFEGKNWSLKDETLKYVSIDCIALHQILMKFGNKIFDRWGVDIKNTPTLPSLCFKIYKSKYMKKNTIPILTGIPYRDIKQSYTGGATDMYIPYGENVWCYDVNSLYPTSMKNYKYPVGKFFSFVNNKGLNITELAKILNRDVFGFVEVDVTCPKDLKHPILQIRREVENHSFRTFAPVGTFTGWFHTEELKAALTLGYSFKIKSGYVFEKLDIFSDYVNDLYSIKVDADQNKDQVWRLISKNLMNSLYGRFGMDQYLVNNTVIDRQSEQVEHFIEKVDIEDVVELGNSLLIQYLPKGYESYRFQEALEIDINVAIAASVTAYSRLIMAEYKNNPEYKLYYTDTDSLYVSFEDENAR